jgi:hypothetical protein
MAKVELSSCEFGVVQSSEGRRPVVSKAEALVKTNGTQDAAGGERDVAEDKLMAGAAEPAVKYQEIADGGRCQYFDGGEINYDVEVASFAGDIVNVSEFVAGLRLGWQNNKYNIRR